MGLRDYGLVKKGLIYFVAIVAVLIGAVVTIPGFLNWNEYKSQVSETLYSQTGHRVNIDGNLVVKLLPSPALSVQAITLLNLEGEPFLKLDSLDINVGFFALLMGRIEAESVVLEGGSLNLIRGADGVGNWQFLISQETESPPSNADTMRFDHIGVKNLEVNYKDDILGRDDSFQNINAIINIDSTKGPFSIQSNYSYGGVNYELEAKSGRVETSRSFPLSFNLIISEQTPGIGFQGTVVLDGAASAASGQFKASGGSLAKVADGLMLLVEGKQPQPQPLDLDKSFSFEAPLVLTKARITARPFTLKAGDVSGEGEVLILPEDGEGVSANVSLKLNSIKVENWLKENAPTTTPTSPNAATIGMPTNSMKVNYSLQIGVINYGGEATRRTHAKGVFDGNRLRIEEAAAILPGDTEVKLSGSVNLSAKPEFRGNLDLNSNNIRDVLTWLGQDVSTIPSERLKAFAMRSFIIIGDGISINDASGQLDGITYNGKLEMTGDTQATYKADLSLSSLDIENYFPSQPLSEAEKTWGHFTKLIEDNLSKLKGLNADIKLKADKFSAGEARFSNLRFDGKLGQNKLEIISFSTTDFKGIKGKLSGNIEGLGGEPRYNLSMDMASPSLAALTRWSGVTLPVDVYKLASVSLKGHMDGTLSQVNLNIEGKAAQANYSLSGYLGGLSPAPDQIDIQISVSGNDHQDFLRRMELPLSLEGAGMSFALNGGLKGKMHSLDTTLTLDLIGGRLSMVGLIDAKADLPTFDLTIEGNHARVINVADALSLGLTPDSDNLGRFQIAGKLLAKNGVYEGRGLRGVFGPSQYGLDVKYDKTGARPKLTGSFSVDGLPLSRFYGRSKTGATAVKKAGGRRWSRTPFELEYLRETDMNFSFVAQEVSYEKYRYKNSRFKVNLEKGVLNIVDLKGVMFDGRVVGQLSLDVNNVPRGKMVLTIEDASLKQALDASAAISPATGSLYLRSDIDFSGISQFDAISSLQGNVELWAQNGVIKAIDIDRISRRLARLNRLPDFISLLGSSLSGGETPFGNIRTNFTGERGLFSARSITADIEGADVEGRMNIDLPKWLMTGTGAITFNDVELPALAPPTKEVVDPQGQVQIEQLAAPPVREVPPIGVDISGDIDNPTINYRTDRLRRFMAERFASSLLNNIIGGEGGLAGIFGRPQNTQPNTQPQATQPTEPAPQDDNTPVNPANIIVNSLFELLQPTPQPQAQPSDDN
jgi:uncharacterized protein involved in outer membrane biogenesis